MHCVLLAMPKIVTKKQECQCLETTEEDSEVRN